MDSGDDTAEAVGFPIRKSPDQSLLAAPQGLSQRATSFIASRRQGIHQMPLCHLQSETPCTGTSPVHGPSEQVEGLRSAKTHLPTCRDHRRIPLAENPSPSRQRQDLFTISKEPLAEARRKTPPDHPKHLPAALDSRRPTTTGWCAPPPRNGGGERDRTDDLLLAKQALSQLSYTPSRQGSRWWAWVDLNYRPHAYQACALTT